MVESRMYIRGFCFQIGRAEDNAEDPLTPPLSHGRRPKAARVSRWRPWEREEVACPERRPPKLEGSAAFDARKKRAADGGICGSPHARCGCPERVPDGV